jgi:rare lipoprotein A
LDRLLEPFSFCKMLYQSHLVKFIKNFLIIVCVFLFTACGSKKNYRTIPLGCVKVSDPSQLSPIRAPGYKIGTPYKIKGKWYTPCEDFEYEEIGYASWYGRECHGKRTANGERFHMGDLTAAHRTLPLSSYIHVTNLDNGKSVVLRVNDRGPYAKRRIIDVSRRGAQVLGFHLKGEAKVRVRILKDASMKVAGLKKGKLLSALKPSSSSSVKYVEAGIFSSYSQASQYQKRLGKVGPGKLQTLHIKNKTVYRLILGPYRSLPRAQHHLKLLRGKGFSKARMYEE